MEMNQKVFCERISRLVVGGFENFWVWQLCQLSGMSISKKSTKFQLAENVSCALPKIPTGKLSHIYPLISPHICLQITKDVQSQRLTVCCHSAVLSTKNEQRNNVGFGIND
jgi:hypothetical protein